MLVIMTKAIVFKTLKITGKIFLGFIVAILLYLAFAYGLSRIPVAEEPHAPDEMAIYILTNGVHTDIVMPTKSETIDWSKHIDYSHTKAADSTHQFVAMGWGDKGFYLETPTWSDLKASVAFKAAFALSSTAIHATYYKNVKESETCKRILISKAQYEKLVQYILDSLEKSDNGQCMHIKTDAHYNQTDAFYEAKGSYSMLHTCNTWSNNALKASGQKACVWTPFDTGIFLQYEGE
jgi:uncharacterized protein (TIGR02117 family)